MLNANQLEIMRKRLRYRSWHRGCKETDLILGHFAEQFLDVFGGEELQLFESLLDENDSDLFKWLTGEEQVPERLKANSVLARLLAFDVPLAVREAAQR